MTFLGFAFSRHSAFLEERNKPRTPPPPTAHLDLKYLRKKRGAWLHVAPLSSLRGLVPPRGLCFVLPPADPHPHPHHSADSGRREGTAKAEEPWVHSAEAWWSLRSFVLREDLSLDYDVGGLGVSATFFIVLASFVVAIAQVGAIGGRFLFGTGSMGARVRTLCTWKDARCRSQRMFRGLWIFSALRFRVL